MSIAPEKLFIDQVDLYSKFDEQGIPTHNAAGEEVSTIYMKTLYMYVVQCIVSFYLLTSTCVLLSFSNVAIQKCNQRFKEGLGETKETF